MRCLGCMELIPDGLEVCPKCGYRQCANRKAPDALSPGILLQGSRFLIGREAGRGESGITYISFDNFLQKKVAIKEYFPSAVAYRDEGEQNICYIDPETMQRCIQNMMCEAQIMQRLEGAGGVAHIHDIFRQNETAYIVMDFVDGITLNEYLSRHGRMTAKECVSLLTPMLDTMIGVHKMGLIHQDFNPDNIMIQPDNTVRLLDFGAAKDLQTEAGNTVPLARNGFSPPEQYDPDNNIGPWTDVYAICATMYYCMTGSVPPGSTVRDPDNGRLPVPTSNPLPPEVYEVLNAGMEMRIGRRISNVEELKQRLNAVFAVPAPARPTAQVKAEEAPGLRNRIRHIFRGRNKPDSDSRVPVAVSIESPFSPPVITSTVGCAATETDSDETVLGSACVGLPVIATLRLKGTGKEVTVSRSCFVIGRISRNAQNPADWQLDDTSRRSSRRHIAVVFDGKCFYVQDITEKNTTQLNGQRLQNCPLSADQHIFSKAYRLQDGDEIALAVDESNPPALTLEFHIKAWE